MKNWIGKEQEVGRRQWGGGILRRKSKGRWEGRSVMTFSVPPSSWRTPCPEKGFGLSCLRFPHREWKRWAVSKQPSSVSKKDASVSDWWHGKRSPSNLSAQLAEVTIGAKMITCRKNYFEQFRVAPVRFGSVTVRGWNGSSGSGFRFRRFLEGGGFCVFQYSLAERTVPVPVSVRWKRFRRFRFRVRFLVKKFRRFRFPVPVRFQGHPGN